MSGWIKVDKKLMESIRFRRVVRKIRDSNALRRVTGDDAVMPVAFYEALALGALVRLWCYADTHIDGDDALDMTLDEINELVGIDGFGQALPQDWLQVLDSNRVQLPDFVAHNGSSEKQRRDNAKRQAAYRKRKQSHNVTRDVTANNNSNEARPDQTREDQNRKKNGSSNHVVDGSTTPVIDPVTAVFEHWQRTWNHHQSKLDDKRRALIRKALASYSEALLCQAITGYLNSPHHTGNNDRGTVYDSIELFLRDAKHIDAGLKFYETPPANWQGSLTRKNVENTRDWQPPEMRRADN